MKCPKCNSENLDDAKFCAGCGYGPLTPQAAEKTPAAGGSDEAPEEVYKRALLEAYSKNASLSMSARMGLAALQQSLKLDPTKAWKLEQEVKAQAEQSGQAEKARRQAEEEARQKAEEESRKKAEEEARKKAEEEARKFAEEQTRKFAEEQARQKAQFEAMAKQQAEETQKRAEEALKKAEEAQKKAEEAQRKAAEAAAQSKTTANAGQFAQPAEAPKASYAGHAKIAFGLSLVGLVLGLFGGIPAVILAKIALNGMKKSQNQDGRGFVIAGMVLGILDILVGLLILAAAGD